MNFHQSIAKLFENIWPQERDFLARPDRFKYVRKLIPASGCVFCECHSQPISSENCKLFETENAMVVLNKYPYNSGHIMVLPRRHCGDLTELTEVEFSETTKLIRSCIGILRSVYQPAGFNIGMNHGAVAGAGIPDHLHWHIVPRWAGDTNFFPIIAETKVLPETNEQTFDKLRPMFEKLKI